MKNYKVIRVGATAVALVALIGLTVACDDDDESSECASLFWFDDEATECAQSEFCGEYMYESLRTFDRQDDCNSAISEVKEECASLFWFDDESTECAEREFCGAYM